jgi:hypothetical protein
MTSIRIASARGDLGVPAFELELAEQSQRAMVGKRIATLNPGANQHRQNCLPSQEDAAKMLNVSARSIRAAGMVLDSGTPELIEAVERDEVQP